MTQHFLDIFSPGHTIIPPGHQNKQHKLGEYGANIA